MAEPYFDPATGLPMSLPDTPGDFTDSMNHEPPVAVDGSGNTVTKEGTDAFSPLSETDALGERARLNFRQAHRTTTLLGSGAAATAKTNAELPAPGPDVPKEVQDFAHDKPFVFDGKMYASEPTRAAAKDQLENIQADILAYNAMRPFKGTTEGAAAISGQAIGMLASPENLLYGAAKAIIGTPLWVARNPIWGGILWDGFSQGLVQATTDPLVQANEVKAGLKQGYEPAQTALALATGTAMGAGITGTHVGASKIWKGGPEYFGNLMRGEKPTPAPEILPPIPAEAPALRPDPDFQGGGPAKATVAKDGVPTGQTRPEPPLTEGNIRLYRKDAPGQPDKETMQFTTKPVDEATSYIDLPEDAVLAKANGDNVTLPKAIAEQRQPIPSTAPPEEAAIRVAARERAAAAEATAGEKITAEPAPETGKSFTEFVREQGGLKPSAEVNAIYGKNRPDIIRKDGKTLDQMREAAVESRYFRDEGIESGGTATTTPNDVLTRLADEDKGIRHYAEGKGPPRKADVRMQEIESDVYAHMQEAGHEPSAKENRGVFRETANMVYRDGLSVENAFERAMMHEGDRVRAARYKPEEIPFETRPKELAGTTPAPAPGSHRPLAVPGSPDSPGAKALQNMHDVIRGITRALNIEVRSGVNKRGVLGTIQGDLVRLAEQASEAYVTLGHEIAHYSERTIGAPLTDLIFRSNHTMQAFAGPSVTSPDKIMTEGFGEFVATYISERKQAELIDPNFLREFENLMKQTPEGNKILDQLDKGHDAYKLYQSTPSVRVVGSMITTRDRVQALPEKDPLNRNAFMRWWDWGYAKLISEQHPLDATVRNVLRDYAKREKKLYELEPQMDPRSIFQVYRNGSHNTTLQELRGGVLDSRTNQNSGPALLASLEQAFADPITGAPAKDAATLLTRKRDFDAYLAAAIHQDLRAQMDAGELILRRPPTGMTDGDAAMTIADMEKAYPHFKVKAEEVYAYNKAMLKKEFDEGLRTKDSYDELSRDINHRWVPLNRNMEGAGGGGGGAGGRGETALAGGVDKPARVGSARDILSPTDMMIENHFRTNELIHYNRGIRVLRDFMRNVGGGRTAKFVEEIPATELRLQDIDVREALTKAFTDAGHTPRQAADMANAELMHLSIADKVKLFRTKDIDSGGRPILYGWESGERFALQLPDSQFGRDLFTAVDFMGPAGIKTVGQAAGLIHDVLITGAGALRAGAVTTPTFAVKNMIRDSFNSFMYINGVKVPFETLVKGAWQMFTEGESARLYRLHAGIEGGASSSAFSPKGQTAAAMTALLTKEGNALTSPVREAIGLGKAALAQRQERITARALANEPLTGIERYTDALNDGWTLFKDGLRSVTQLAEKGETANRIGVFHVVYTRNRAMGRSEEFSLIDAAQKARDTMDFGRHGSKMELTVKLVPFLGASVQGADKFLRATITDLIRPAATAFEAAEKADQWKNLIWKFATLATVTAAFEAIYQDDSWYQRLPLQQRASNWNFKIFGTPVSIPKPFEWAQALGIAELAVKYTNTGDSQHIYNWLKSFQYTFNLPSSIPFVSSALGLAGNYDDFNHRPIVPERLQSVFPHMQRLNDTGKFYIALAELLNKNVWNSQDAHQKMQAIPLIGGTLAAAWSPIESEWLVRRTFGSWPRELGGILGMGKSMMSGEIPQMQDIPVIRSMIQTKMSYGEPIREIINQTNQHDGRMGRALTSYNLERDRGNTLGAQEIFDNLDPLQQQYVRLHQVNAGAVVNAMHPMDRAKAVYTAAAIISNGLQDKEYGLASSVNPAQRIKIDPDKVQDVTNLLTEYTANQARNTLIIQNVPGYKGQATVPTQPDLEKLKAMAPEVYNDFAARMQQAKVLPFEVAQKYWPEVQRIASAGGNAKVMEAQLKAIGRIASVEQGFEGGARSASKGAIIEGQYQKRESKKPAQIAPTDRVIQ